MSDPVVLLPNPPRAFSYLRFSTPEQQRGDSFRRQRQLAQDYADKNGLTLDERSFEDLGVSAFRGANVETGRLGEFVEAVKTGAIPKGSYLLVESLDRISRNAAARAAYLLQSICYNGVVVVTLSDEQVYTADSIDDNPLFYLQAVLISIRAHEESDMKSRRLKAVWAQKRATASDKPLTARLPGWLKLDNATGKIVEIPEKADVVRRIFDLAASGVGQHAIAKTLNEDKVPSFGRSRDWNRSYVKKILGNPAVVGTLIPCETVEDRSKLRGKSRRALEPVLGYYPAVVSEDVFHSVQAASGAGRAPSYAAANGVKSLLASLAKCPKCGETMTRVFKGPGGGRPYLVCTKAKKGAGCQYKQIKQATIEDALLRNIRAIIRDVPTGDDNVDRELEQIDASLMGFDDQLDILLDNLSVQRSPALAQRLRDLENERDKLLAEKRRLQKQASTISTEVRQRRLAALEEAVSAETIDIAAANSLLRQVLARVIVNWPDGELDLEWKHGGITSVPLMLSEFEEEAFSAAP